MRTAFRGFGSYKQLLLDALIQEFGTITFTYHDAKRLPEFEHRTFMALYSDEWVKRLPCVGKPNQYFIPRSILQIRDIQESGLGKISRERCSPACSAS